MTYSIVSVSPASSTNLFFMDALTGRLYLVDTFTSAPSRPSQYQITVLAEDHGIPQRADSAVVTLGVIRNTQPPVFQPSFYTVSIDETAAVNDQVVAILATDGDTVVGVIHECQNHL
jgi:hypothetical protein